MYSATMAIRLAMLVARQKRVMVYSASGRSHRAGRSNQNQPARMKWTVKGKMPIISQGWMDSQNSMEMP